MYSDFKEKAIDALKEAVREDENGIYGKAIEKYYAGLEYLEQHLKYDENEQSRQAIKAKYAEYLNRAEYLTNALNFGVQEGGAPYSEVSSQGLTRARKEYGTREAKSRMQEILSQSIISEKPGVKWDDAAGWERAKEALKEDVIMPFKFPLFFTGKFKPCSQILLYGPPGTGKSYLAKALATEFDSQFFSIVASDLVSKWMGESEKLVSTLFEMAKQNTPAIVFFDDLDALCNASGDDESEAARRIKTQIVLEMRLLSVKDSRVLILGATNLPHVLDKALLRQFGKRIYIPLPDAPAREEMFRIHLGAAPNKLGDKDFEDLGAMTEGFLGSDISAVVKEVLKQPLRFAMQATHFRQIPCEEGPNYMPCRPTSPEATEINLQYFAKNGIGDKVVPPLISMKGFEIVLETAKPTVRKADSEMFERFREEFGEES